MLAKSGRLRAVCTSSRHPRGIQSLLALFLALGGFTGQLLGSPNSRYGQIPLTFIENHGQTHPSVHFLAKGPGMTAYFTSSEVVVDLHPSVVRMRYLGGKAAPDVRGLDPQAGQVNYLIGADPSKWKTNMPLFGRVIYRDLYPGIDMVYSAQARWLKSEFVAAPGADTSRIRIEYAGVRSIRTDEDGRLVLVTADGELREEAPKIYQESGGSRIPVEGGFRVSGNVVSFEVGGYDHSLELRIDPVLSYSTYLGGSGTDKGNAIAVDSSGAAFVTGFTDSTDFPLSGGVIQGVSGGSTDVFVTKLNAGGNAIVYSTYLGGNGDDRGFSIAVDGTGNAYVTGWTSSQNFPLVGAAQASFGGIRNAFVAKLNPAGSALVYSTYLGGAGTDSGNGIALDSANAAYVTGSTNSSNFPAVGAIQTTLAGGLDVFVTKLSASGSAILYSTYLGGAADDRGSSIAVDSTGAAYVAGNTSSTNFPTVSAFQVANGGAPDGFVAKLNPGGTALVYSTYLGGSGVENVELGRSIAVDSSGSAYVAGTTSSANFPTSLPMQASLNGSQDSFVVKLSSAGSALVYGTYLGGSSIDYGESIAVDSSGVAYIAGYTASTDFPIVNGDQPVNGGGYDAFLVKLNSTGSTLVESDFLGGSGNDAAYGIAVDSTGSAYLTGQTLSFNFPLKTPVQASLGSTLAAFVAKFTFGPTGPPTAISVTPASGSGSSQTFTLLYSDSRGFADISWVEMNWNTTHSTANACYLHYARASNALQLSNDAGSGWAGSATLGAVGTLQNSQCSVDTGASAASGSGNNLTLNLTLTFKPAFAGSKTTFMQVQDVSNTLAPWLARGAWLVVTAPPVDVSVSPASGSGTAQTFSFVYSDPYGNADIGYVDFLFQTALSGTNACYAVYVPASNLINLLNDNGTTIAGSGTPGIPGTLNNSQCSIDPSASSMSASGNNLTLTVAVTFKPAFGGAKNIYMLVGNKSNVTSTFQSEGAWSVPISPPANVSVSPASGSGTAQMFSFVYSDPLGNGDIGYVDFLFQTTLSGSNACYAVYVPASNLINLLNDAGTAIVGSGTPGVAGTLSNSQCSINTSASSMSVSGSNLTLTVAVTFTAVFGGAKNIYMLVGDNSNVTSGWQAKGVWTDPISPPVNVSVSPASGSGTAQTFSFVYSDPLGNSDIGYVDFLFQTTLTGSSACYAVYVPASNLINLLNDAGTAIAGSGTPGVAGTLSNSQCSINTGASSVSVSGNNLTLTVAVTFKPAFDGVKNIYMLVGDKSNVTSAFQAEGVWTVQ